MTKTRTVYLAGGINGLDDSQANDWRTQAKDLLPRRLAVLDPMDRDYRGKEDDNVEAIVNGDLADILASDYIIANCPRPSWGTAMEIHYAASRTQMKTVAIVPEGQPVSPWLRHHTAAIVPTVEEAVELILGWAGL